MKNNTIQESQDNNFILAQMLQQEVKQARYNNSTAKVLNELGIEVLQ